MFSLYSNTWDAISAVAELKKWTFFIHWLTLFRAKPKKGKERREMTNALFYREAPKCRENYKMRKLGNPGPEECTGGHRICGL